MALKDLQNKILTPRQLAARWKLSAGALALRRFRGDDPKFFRIGRSVYYELADVERYEISQRKL